MLDAFTPDHYRAARDPNSVTNGATASPMMATATRLHHRLACQESTGGTQSQAGATPFDG